MDAGVAQDARKTQRVVGSQVPAFTGSVVVVDDALELVNETVVCDPRNS